jgi:hypothetical protein
MNNRVLFVRLGRYASVWESFAAELLRHNEHPNSMQHMAIEIGTAET